MLLLLHNTAVASLLPCNCPLQLWIPGQGMHEGAPRWWMPLLLPLILLLFVSMWPLRGAAAGTAAVLSAGCMRSQDFKQAAHQTLQLAGSHCRPCATLHCCCCPLWAVDIITLCW